MNRNKFCVLKTIEIQIRLTEIAAMGLFCEQRAGILYAAYLYICAVSRCGEIKIRHITHAN